MPSSNQTVTVAFKVSNSVHAAVHQWLYDQADSPSELVRAAVIAIYGYRAIEQTDAPPEKKMRALLESNAELSKLLELNKAIASITSGALPSTPMSSVIPSTSMDLSTQCTELVASPKAVEDNDEGWDDDTLDPLEKSEESKSASKANKTEDPTDLL
jgi:hypothetical protein